MLYRALKAVREVHRLQQQELASRLGISRSHLSELESGKKNATIELLKRYSEVFDVPASTFLSFTEALEGESDRRRARAKKLLSALEWLNEEPGSDGDLKSRKV
jgi:transcriptional regulator with XRE-family HTH domain